MINYNDWESYLYEQVRNGSIYLWGGQGESLEKLTDEYIEKRETSATNARRAKKLRDARKAMYPNLKAYDCSGLGVYELLRTREITSDMTANGIMRKCEAKKKTEIVPGDFVFRVSNGSAYHIGYVVKDNMIIHAKGRDDGVVLETLNANGETYWNAFGKSPWVAEYVKPVEVFVFSKNLKKGSKGAEVKSLQTLLNKEGYACGSADGIFGSNTLKAVKAVQKNFKLKQDGIFGKNTCKALGGIWKA